MRYGQIERPELEHIAPIKEPSTNPHGYDEYTEEFKTQYIDCLGNYLLLSKSHNSSIHNDPFPIKHKDYIHLEQQREVGHMVSNSGNEIWSRELINNRKKIIIDFILTSC